MKFCDQFTLPCQTVPRAPGVESPALRVTLTVPVVKRPSHGGASGTDTVTASALRLISLALAVPIVDDCVDTLALAHTGTDSNLILNLRGKRLGYVSLRLTVPRNLNSRDYSLRDSDTTSNATGTGRHRQLNDNSMCLCQWQPWGHLSNLDFYSC